MKQLSKNEIENKLKELYKDYKDEVIGFFIEINDEHTNQLFQTTTFERINDCLDWLNSYCIFLDAELETWLMYEVEGSDIDRFADIKLTPSGYKLFD